MIHTATTATTTTPVRAATSNRLLDALGLGMARTGTGAGSCQIGSSRIPTFAISTLYDGSVLGTRSRRYRGGCAYISYMRRRVWIAGGLPLLLSGIAGCS